MIWFYVMLRSMAAVVAGRLRLASDRLAIRDRRHFPAFGYPSGVV
jgi:hypothetical protein